MKRPTLGDCIVLDKTAHNGWTYDYDKYKRLFNEWDEHNGKKAKPKAALVQSSPAVFTPEEFAEHVEFDDIMDMCWDENEGNR